MRNLLVYDEAAREVLDRYAFECRKARVRCLSPEKIMRLAMGAIFNANNFLTYDAATILAVNAFTATLNSGFLRIYTGTQPAVNGAITGTQLASLTFSATAFPTAVASGGVVTATANAITSASAGNTGTAGYHALLQSNGTTIVATGTVGTSGSDLNMSTTSVTSGNTVACSSYLINMAE